MGTRPRLATSASANVLAILLSALTPVLAGTAGAGPPPAASTEAQAPLGVQSAAAIETETAGLPLQLGRLRTQQQDGVTVQLAIPTEEQAAKHFGVPLAEAGIQPIWLRIENTSDHDYWLLPVSIDPDYYSADEVALVTLKKVPKDQRAAHADQFRQHALPFFSAARSTNEGYVYASHMRGGRFVDIRMTGNQQGIRMRFAVLLPTEGFDYERSSLKSLYEKVDDFPNLGLEELRARLRELPCCATNTAGDGEGDPLNVVIVGTGEEAISALAASGWSFTEAITADSVRRMVGAAITEKSFLTAPVSSLYAFGRKQDVALQRGRTTISQRNHMRLWLARFRSEGRPVWVGQVSRDIGVKATTRSTTLTTHVIDPVIDESREYLLHSLMHHDAVSRFAFVRGVGDATHVKPRHNLTGDPYITDGMRLVIWISSEPVDPNEARNLGWNLSTDPVLEGRGEYSKVPPKQD
ncbi:MAG: LssY C-terminal domain-containing protein [Proteobacteria bacterium]|nr:LssY C-terminal domain-containing protein [Pseudomonadota bacterium]